MSDNCVTQFWQCKLHLWMLKIVKRKATKQNSDISDKILTMSELRFLTFLTKFWHCQNCIFLVFYNENTILTMSEFCQKCQKTQFWQCQNFVRIVRNYVYDFYGDWNHNLWYCQKCVRNVRNLTMFDILWHDSDIAYAWWLAKPILLRYTSHNYFTIWLNKPFEIPWHCTHLHVWWFKSCVAEKAVYLLSLLACWQCDLTYRQRVSCVQVFALLL